MNTDISKHAIAVHVGNPTMIAAGMVFPADNWIGAGLLSKLLQLALLRDGIQILLPGFRGPLNDCVLTFAVDDREAAIETIKAELAGVRLLSFCQIAVSDGAGWKCIHPSPGVKIEWLLHPERQELFSSQLDQAIENHLRKPEGETGDKE
jgi:hypothetical protein